MEQCKTKQNQNQNIIIIIIFLKSIHVVKLQSLKTVFLHSGPWFLVVAFPLKGLEIFSLFLHSETLLPPDPFSLIDDTDPFFQKFSLSSPYLISLQLPHWLEWLEET